MLWKTWQNKRQYRKGTVMIENLALHHKVLMINRDDPDG
jgi:hypothetical protein